MSSAPQHERDDLGRENLGEIVDHVEAAHIFDPVQQPVHDPVDQRVELGQFAGSEGTGEQLAHHGMLGRIVEDERGGVMGVKRAFPELLAEFHGLVRQHVAALIDLLNIGITRQKDRPVCVFMHRAFAPQTGERGVGVVDEIAADFVDVEPQVCAVHARFLLWSGDPTRGPRPGKAT